MTRVLVPSLLLLASVGFAADAAPAPAATAPAIDMNKVSAPVTEGMKKITSRIVLYSKGGSLSDAGRKDIAAKVLKMDDDVTTPEDSQWIVSLLVQQHFVPEGTDYPTLLQIARNGGVVPPKTEPKPAEAVKKEEPKPVAKAEEKPAATPAAAAAAPTAPAAPAAPVFVPGVKVKLYTYEAGAVWPPKEFPKFPIASLEIPALNDVLPAWVQRNGKEVPNRLIEHAALDAARYYAVSYSGFVYAKKDGVHGISVESDDPVVVYFVDGNRETEIGRSDWSIKLSDWVMKRTYDLALTPKEKTTNQVVITTPELSTGRYYGIKILASQHWKSSARLDGFDNENFGSPEDAKALNSLCPTICGATLKVRWIAPDSEPAPIRLYQPEQKRVKRDE